MSFSVAGFLLFVLPHVLSSIFPAVRDRAKAWVGEPKFKGSYAAISLLGFILMVIGYWQSRSGGAGSEMLYVPIASAKSITMVLVPIGFILLAASSGKSHLRYWLQNPMSVGIAFWSVGHLLSNGKISVIWFFAAMLLVALMDIVSSMLRGKRPVYEPRWGEDLKAVVIGIALVAILAGLFHPFILGVKLQ
jgi:uncharacterized membrane protein